ncbi:hypothetical protein T09_2342 [Trichinella sp. T9]|nr:hypothetical protein T09_2342 [Trichinella sp. T9]
MTISATITSSKSNNHHKSERTKRDCRARDFRKPAYKAGKRAKREHSNENTPLCTRSVYIHMREEEQYEQYQKQYHQQW